VPGPTIAILVGSSQFEVALPDIPSVSPETFQNNAAGLRSFVSWVKPKLATLSPSDEPVKICLLGGEPIESQTAIEIAVCDSIAPIAELEPFDASIRLLSEGERSRGITKRALRDAIRYARGERL
jgi:hypothetical protein